MVQDRSLDLLTSSPARYHCATDAPICMEDNHTIMEGSGRRLYCWYVTGYIYIYEKASRDMGGEQPIDLPFGV